MMRYFDVDELKRSRLNARMWSVKFERLHELKLRNVKDLCGRLPDDGECFFIETTKSFNAFTFIVYLIKTTGCIENLYIATYSINKRIIASLMKWKTAGLIGSVHIHISQTIKFRSPSDYRRLTELAENDEIKLSLEWTHKKVSCMKTPAGYFVVEGSGNYGENAMEEQYLFTQNKGLYEFRTKTNQVSGSELD